MLCKKNFCIALLSALTITAYAVTDAKKTVCGANKKNCKDLRNSCQCYCSKKCGPRDKKPDDKPVYVENDPAGNYCYCKQWDLDNYKSRGCDVQDQDKKARE
jgi:hypothetical protein